MTKIHNLNIYSLSSKNGACGAVDNKEKINLNSSDKERAEILKSKSLTIIPSIPEMELEYNENDVIRDAIVDYAYRLNLIGKQLNLPDYSSPIKINEHTITESLHIMRKRTCATL